MLQRSGENSGSTTPSSEGEPRRMDAPEGQAADSPTTAATTSGWPKATTTVKPAGTGHRRPPNLADIMAEQTDDRVAAHAVYENSESLAEVEEEQEGMFQSLQGRLRQQPEEQMEETKCSVEPNKSTDSTEQDEMIMLEMVMRQSLAEYNHQNSDIEFKDGAEDPGPLPDKPLRSAEEEEPIDSTRKAPVRTQSLSMRDLRLNDSNHSRSSVSELMCRSESALAFSLAKPTLHERDFSTRTLRDIERTEIIVDNPHVDAEMRRRRLTKHGSLTRPKKRRGSLMNEARKHLSAREMSEIEQALLEADEVQESPCSPSQPTTRQSRPPQWEGVGGDDLSPRGDPRMSPSVSPRHSALPRSPQSAPVGHRSTRTPQSSLSAAASLPSLDPPRRFESPPRDRSSQGSVAAFLSLDESAAIEAAIKEADAREEEESLMLAFQMQQEEIAGMQGRRESSRPGRQAQGNVRSMTRAEIDFESQQVAALYEDEGRTWVGANSTSEPPPVHPLAQQALASAQQERARAPGAILETRPPARHPLEEGNDQEEAAGFRMNSASAQQWSRRDRNTIVGPNNEVRTKHDVQVQGQTNAEWLGLDADDYGVRAHVGNRAFNSFRASLKQTSKGVASHGTGRAGSDSDAIKGRAMDPHVRLQISRAINAGLIESCNGAVKQGKEAIVYHADQGAGSNGFDVAVKVFKRIQEFRGRGEYVDGDPRYAGRPFRRLTEREQLELWTEKEFRNLVRANRAKVPVPSPLHYKENIIFMRFIGNGGWPAPQIRELEMRTGSKKWDVLYTQVMESVRRLYVGARLVHGDLSEYNILVAPVFQVDNPISSVEDTTNDLQAVLIDFGQAVDLRHPEAMNLLRRDLDRVRAFFKKQGVKTLDLEEAVEFVVDDFANEVFNESSNTLGVQNSLVDASVVE